MFPSIAPRQALLHEQVMPLLDALIRDAETLRLKLQQLPGGSLLIDAGAQASGGLEAGRRIAEILLGGLGRVDFTSDGCFPLSVHVQSSHPLLACLGCQYAGWNLQAPKEGTEAAFSGLGSGPARLLAHKEELLQQLGMQEQYPRSLLVVEGDRPPPAKLLEKIAQQCGISTTALCLILTPTSSLAGMVQIVSRVLEVALHKLHSLHFPLDTIVDGHGQSPVPPPTKDFLNAMGRSNDAILFGGQVQLFCDASDTLLKGVIGQLPSMASRDYGQPFAAIFKTFEYDFFRIDPMLFSPAEIRLVSLQSGNTFVAGKLDHAAIERSFGATQCPIQR